MEKKLYLPTDEELDLLSKYINLNKYLSVKILEAVILKGIKGKNESIINEENKELVENEFIYRGICKLYPKEIEKSLLAKNDVELCLYLLKQELDNNIYNLDNLSFFDTNNIYIKNETIEILSNKLNNNPKYRFQYKKSDLLDEIFSCSYDYNDIVPSINKENLLIKLSIIDPVYLVKAIINNGIKSLNQDDIKKILNIANIKYTNRYTVVENEIGIGNINDNKKLLKQMKKNNNIFY